MIPSYEKGPRQIGHKGVLHIREAGPIKWILRYKLTGGQNFHFFMLILELASNITLRLFLRPFEAVLSLKSLFERVPGGLQGSYFVWRAKMRNYYHLESSLEAVRPFLKSEAARGRSSDLEPPRGQIWHPEVRASHLSIIYGGLGGSRSLERPRAASDLKSGRTASRLVSRW